MLDWKIEDPQTIESVLNVLSAIAKAVDEIREQADYEIMPHTTKKELVGEKIRRFGAIQRAAHEASCTLGDALDMAVELQFRHRHGPEVDEDGPR